MAETRVRIPVAVLSKKALVSRAFCMSGSGSGAPYQPWVLGPPLKGPVTREVIQPP